MKYTGHYLDNRYSGKSLSDIQAKMLFDIVKNDNKDYETAWIFEYTSILNRWTAQYYYSIKSDAGWRKDEIDFWTRPHWSNAIQPFKDIVLELGFILGKIK